MFLAFISHEFAGVFCVDGGGADYLGAEETSISSVERSSRWSGRLKDTRSKIRMVSLDSLVILQWISDICGSELLNLPDVVNDLDFDLAIDPVAAAAYMNDQRNLRKVREHTAKLQLNIINPPRPGKRLLVLDIDYSEIGVVFVLDLLMLIRNRYQQYSIPNPLHPEPFLLLNVRDQGCTNS